jgi:UTP:GlnB (protein PII) uridylyltransferase
VGERAEDVFFLCDRKQRPLTLDLREKLKQALLDELDDPPDARQ